MPTKEEQELNFRNDAIKTIKGLSEENARLKEMYGRKSRLTASDIRARNSQMGSNIKGLATLKNALGSIGSPKAPYKSKNSLDLSDLT